jgi:hypothetical protein
MFKITHEYICDICGKSEPYPYSYTNDRVDIPKPKMPVGWSECREGYICGNHSIDIDLDLEQLVINYLANVAQTETTT